MLIDTADLIERHGSALDRVLRQWQSDDVVRRLWAGDASLWYPAAETQARIRERVGWLRVPQVISQGIADSSAWLRDQQATRAVLLVSLGGTQLVARTWLALAPPDVARAQVVVLDTIDPATVRTTLDLIKWSQTSVIIVYDYDVPPELHALSRIVLARTQAEHGNLQRVHLIAPPAASVEIDRSDAQLIALPPDVAERFAALTVAGVLPAMLAGLDPQRLGHAVHALQSVCVQQADLRANAGVWLGAILGTLAQQGRDKLALLVPPRLEALARWITAITAGSLSKHGRGFVPVVVASPSEIDVDRTDQIFLVLDWQAQADPLLSERVAVLHAAQQPTIHIRLADAYDVAALMLCWQVAIASAALVIGLNPFDEPDTAGQHAYVRARLQSLPQAATADDEPLEQTLARNVQTLRGANWIALVADCSLDGLAAAQLDRLREVLERRVHCPVVIVMPDQATAWATQLLHAGRQNGVVLMLHADGSDVLVPGETWSMNALRQTRRAAHVYAWQQRNRAVVRLPLDQPTARSIALIADLLGHAL